MMLSKMKIQPINSSEIKTSNEAVKPVAVETKSRIKRIFEKQFPKIRRSSSLEKRVIDLPKVNSGGGEFDLSSVCLDKMVKNFIEESNHEKQQSSINCSRKRCNCFNGIRNSSSDDEDYDDDEGDDEVDDYSRFDLQISFSTEAFDILKNLVQCSSVNERNLHADVAKIVEKNKSCKRKDDICRKILTDGLLSLGYNASVCKSHWDKTPSFPAGEYEYIDVISEGERLIIDIDFRSEFEIVISSKSYKQVLQILPFIFVGKSDRLQRIIGIVTEAAKRSFKKKGMHFPPWRKAEYVKSKWLSPLQVTKASEFEEEKATVIKPRMNEEQKGVKQIITGFKLQ